MKLCTLMSVDDGGKPHLVEISLVSDTHEFGEDDKGLWHLEGEITSISIDPTRSDA